MKYKLSFITLCMMLMSPVFAAEEITVDYTYGGEPRVDLANMSRGPLKIGNFSDSRDGDPNLITDAAGGYIADRPLAEIVRDALVQGLGKANAQLAESDENMTLVGTVVSSEATMLDENGVSSIRLTIRTQVQLRGSRRTIWQTVLFGRGTAPQSEGIEQALANALDRTISGLLQDQYFLIEIQ